MESCKPLSLQHSSIKQCVFPESPSVPYSTNLPTRKAKKEFWFTRKILNSDKILLTNHNLMASWFSSTSSNSGEGDSSTENAANTRNVGANLWAAWTDTEKWQEFASKTQKDAQRLVEVAGQQAQVLSHEAGERAMVLSREASKLTKEATKQASMLSQQALEMKNNIDPNDVSNSILNTFGYSGRVSANRNRKVNIDEMDFIHITENIVTMSFPVDHRKKKMSTAGVNDIFDVSSYLEANHKGHYMICNISEESYDYSLFENQVLEYRFPGHPAPPLGVMFKICVAIENWLDADDRNIAIIHCLTGKGRTAALTSCVLAWMGEFASPVEALHYMCQRRDIAADVLTIASQRRYIQYFGNMLDGIKPRSEPVLLRRVIMSTIPKFGKKIERNVTRNDDGTESVEDSVEHGCAPYIQLFKNGHLIATATATAASSADNDSVATSVNSKSKALHLAWIPTTEGSASFAVNTPIRGDILLRCRHANGGDGAERVSMFRAAFHTGYVPSGVLRLTKEQLDGPIGDSRFDEDFFIDLIFAPVVKSSMSSSATPSAPSTSSAAGVVTPAGKSHADSTTSSNSPAIITTAKRVSDGGLEIIESSDKYEESLHKDKRFWDNIAARKQKAKKRKSRKFDANKTDHFIIESNVQDAEIEGEPSEPEAEEESKPRLGISDDDLLAQLAYAEELLGESELKSSDVDCGKSDSMKDYLVVDDVASERSDTVLVDSSVSTAANSNSNATPPPASVLSTPANKELEALEALERELGLDDLNLFSTPTPAKTNVPVSSIDDGDSLEDLEKYLQSINDK